MKNIPPIFTVKWKDVKINPKFAAFMFSTLGIPPHILESWINNRFKAKEYVVIL